MDMQTIPWDLGIPWDMLTNFYLKEKGFKFLLGGRFSTDAIENFFSCVRYKNKAPTPLEWRRNIKALVFVQFLRPNKNGSYQEDDREANWLAALEDVKKVDLTGQKDEEMNDDHEFILENYQKMDFHEENNLSHAIGYILKKTICSISACSSCQDAFTTKDDNLEVHAVTRQRCYVPGALVYPSKLAYELFSTCNSGFVANQDYILSNEDATERFAEQLIPTLLLKFQKDDVPRCHLELLLRRFFKLRMIWTVSYLNDRWKMYEKNKKEIRNRANSSKSLKGFYAS